MEYGLCFSLVFLCSLAAATADINPDDVRYVFYSRENFYGVYDDYNFVHTRGVFNRSLPTIVLIHGWQDDYGADSNTFVRQAILSKINANIIKVDWGVLANQGYFAARDAVPFVGRLTAKFLRNLSEHINYSLSQITLVGFSLGAHVSGNIGKALPGEIEVILALDPAGPFISSTDVEFSIHPSDAKYVQGIHTNGGTLGTNDAIGHSDFYPNGGSRQPGCGVDLLGGCAHNRAWEFFAESVTQNGFLAYKCDSWDNFRAGKCRGESRRMGGLQTVDKNARGKFYLETNSASPYRRG